MCYTNQEKLEARQNVLHVKRPKHDSEHDPTGVLKVIEYGCSIECKSSSDGSKLGEVQENPECFSQEF